MMTTAFRPVRAARLLLLALAGVMTIGAAPGGTMLVDVGNVRNAKGRIHVDVCPQAMFLKEDCPFSGEAPAHVGVTAVTIHGVPAGHYAIQATHDENSNGKVDRGLFGIPTEGIGFSRDARIRFGPPKWADAVLAFDGHYGHVAFALRYFSGPSGPPQH